MSQCRTCKNFDQRDPNTPSYLGECCIEFPRWLNVIVKEDSRVVRADDTCSFYKEEESK